MNLTVDELAERLRCTPRFVSDRCRTGRWPHLKVGQKTVFTPVHVEVITAQLERKPVRDAEAEVRDLVALGVSRRSAARHRTQVPA